MIRRQRIPPRRPEPLGHVGRWGAIPGSRRRSPGDGDSPRREPDRSTPLPRRQPLSKRPVREPLEPFRLAVFDEPLGSPQPGNQGRRLRTRSRIAVRWGGKALASHARSGGISSPFGSNRRPGDAHGPVDSYRQATTVGQTELRSCCPASPRPVCRTRRCSVRGGSLRRSPPRCGSARTGSRVRRGVD